MVQFPTVQTVQMVQMVHTVHTVLTVRTAGPRPAWQERRGQEHDNRADQRTDCPDLRIRARARPVCHCQHWR